MRLLVLIALLLFAASSSAAQRAPRPAGDLFWLTEPALLATYVATMVPTGLAPYAGDAGAIALIGAGYVLGPLAGWTVAGDVPRGVPWAAGRAVLYSGAVWTFLRADYQGWEDFPEAMGHTLLATAVLILPYAFDVGALQQHVLAERRNGLVVGPAFLGSAPGLHVRVPL